MSGSETEIQWFIARDGKQHGPVSDVELRKLVELSHLKAADLIWRQGFSDWRTAASVFPTIAEAPAAPKPATPASAPTPSAAPSPATSSPSPSSMTPTTAARPVTGPAPQSGSSSMGGAHIGPAQSSAGLFAQSSSPKPAQENWRPSGDFRPDQIATRPLGNQAAARTAGPFPAGAPAPRPLGEPRSHADLAPLPRDEPIKKSGRGKKALVAIGLLAMTGAGAWMASQYKDQIFGFVQSQSGSANGTATANVMPPSSTPPAAETAAAPAPAVQTAEEIDRKLQGRTMWVSVKQEFPDWYQTRVAEVARLSAEHKDPEEITRYLVSQIVALRRENAQYALAASTPRHKELAAAFLANLNQLSKESGDGCYEFISKGESSTAIVSRMDDPSRSAEIEAQVVAIVAAITEGRKQPSQHAAPVKTDYDVLAGELGRLGWTQADMQLFANPRELAKAPRDRVCNMLKDWFTAHLAIQDPSTQERLLFETLKPVISG